MFQVGRKKNVFVEKIHMPGISLDYQIVIYLLYLLNLSITYHLLHTAVNKSLAASDSITHGL